jgi:serine/threonine-protein kinase RsbW
VRKKFQVDSDLSIVQKTSQDVLSFLTPASLEAAVLFDVRLCLEEALINAMKYGNGLQKEVPVELDVEFTESQIRITVKDQGPGFNPKKLEDCTDEKNLFRNRGRGVYLIHQLMDEVRYNEKGNCLLMIKSLTKQNHPQNSKSKS